MAERSTQTGSSQTPQGKLIVCPTPIGNLGDMTARATQALASADVVCAEDTRVTGKLLSALGLSKRIERLDEATIGKRAEAVAQRVCAGEVIAYCSDAGMPGVSDPGMRLIAAVREAGGQVEVLPGPSAAITAYVASGTACPRFYFGGFFPRKAGERVEVLAALRNLDAALIFYESPNRIASALDAIAKAFPLREVCVCRELTKLHEEIVRDAASAIAAQFAERERNGGVKGELVIVVDAPSDGEAAANDADMQRAARDAAVQLAQAGVTKKDTMRQLQERFGISRNAAYRIVHES